MRLPPLLALVSFGLMAAALSAQDVTVIGPIWTGSKPAPESLPPLKGFRVPYPEDARKGGEIGYVLFEDIVDVSGKAVGRRIAGNFAVFERTVDEAGDWHVAPAVRGGAPIESVYDFAVLFNPASAAAGKPNATPRLLSVPPGPLRVTSEKFKTLAGVQMVDAVLHLDEQGQVVDVGLPAGIEDCKAEVLRQLHLWRFAPARQGGRPIAATVSLPLVAGFVMPPKRDALGEKAAHMPVPIRQPGPVYPPDISGSNLVGQVLVEFIVDPTGAVKDATVIHSNNPGFEAAALEAVSRWKFKPATRADGTPLAARMRVPMTFQLENWGGRSGSDLMTVSGGSSSKLPPELRFDVAPKASAIVFPVYPYELLRDDVNGDATVAFMISARGHVASTHVQKASRPEFGLAMEAAAAAIQFDPALRQGEPTATIVSQREDFRTGDDWIGPYSPRNERALLRELRKHPDEVVSPSRLDGKLHPIQQRLPVFPPNLLDGHGGGEAVIEIVIDQDGRARLPRIVSASQPEFGYAAAQAAVGWRFEPPLSGGKKVMVRADVPFAFKAP